MEFLKELPEDHRIFISINIFVIILGFFMRFIKGRQLRLIYSLIPGVVFQYLLYGPSTIHVWLSLFANIYITRKFEREKLGKISLIYNFIHNSIIHLVRLIYEPSSWRLEISTIFMMITCKFTGLAISYSNYIKTNLNKEQEKYKIKDFTYLEIASYTFFFPTTICGPFIEFNDFISFIEEKDEFANIPNTTFIAIKRFLQAVLLAVLNIFFLTYGRPELVVDGEGKFNIFQRIICFYFGGFLLYKYFAAFSFCEAGILASGFAYEGKVKNENGVEEDSFNRARAIEIFKVSTISFPTFFFRYWNISVHVWLKRYLYTSFLQDNATYAQKQLASSKTFFVSAFWHGFNMTYFVTFFHFFWLTFLENQLRIIMKSLRKETYERIDKIYNCDLISAIFLNIFMIPYLCLMWQCLDVEILINFLRTTYFTGSIVIIGGNIIAYIYIKLFVKRKEEKKE